MLVCLCLYTIVLHSGFSYLLPLFTSPSPLSGVHPSLLHSGFSSLLPLFASPSPLSGVHPFLLHSGLPTPPSP